jgi:hypothetical protein
LLPGEDQSLLVRGNSLLVLNLGLNIIDGIGGLDLKGDGLARKGLDEAVIIVSVSNSIHGAVDGGAFGGSYICTERRKMSALCSTHEIDSVRRRSNLLFAVVYVVVDVED